MPAVDLEQARTFLARLGSGFTFQTLDDSRNHRPSLTRVLHGGLTEHGATLARLNASGAGVFVMVNAGDGKARKASNVQRVRACFADLDGAPLAPVQAFPLQPHIVVESSPGRWHAYWLTEGTPPAEFKPMQQAIAQRFDADPKVCDLPRVMRLPGFFHNKGEPFLSRVISQHDGAPYSHAAMVEAFGLALPNKAPAVARRTLAAIIPKGERNSTLFALACGLVNKGIPAAGVNEGAQRMNAERCQPPLCASEVDVIAARASGYGSQGFDRLPHALTAAARWDDMHLKAGEWRIPAEVMKTRQPFTTSLPAQVLDVLREMHARRGDSAYAFPPQARQKTPHLHRDSLSKALREMGFQGTHSTHDFRASLRTLGRERLKVDADVLEAQLAHAPKDEVAAAYARVKFKEQRREVVQAWADYLDKLKADNVVGFKRKA